MLQQHYLYLSSDDSLQFFKNEPHDFNVRLNSTLNLQLNRWVVGLVDFIYEQKTIPHDTIVITCDIITSSFYKSKQINILRLLHSEDTSQLKPPSLNRPLYVPISRENISCIRIRLLDKDLNPLKQLTAPVTCLLHLRTLPK